MQKRILSFQPLILISAIIASPLSWAKADAEPLHSAIDRLIAERLAEQGVEPSPQSSDTEFLRRVTLDLTGTIPTVEQVREFLSDPAPDKRRKVIDRLLESPEYARHMQHLFDVMLMRRLSSNNVSVAEWEKFLRTSFAENRPWNEIVSEILTCDGSDADHRGPARFYLDRAGDVDEITRDVARVFLGVNLECAQCHNHPEVDDWKQAHYYGLSAFFVRSYLFTDAKKKTTIYAEKGEGEVEFESVFQIRDKTSPGAQSTPPRLFDGEPITEPAFKKGEEYKVKPAKNVRPIPKFSRRSQVAAAVTASDNVQFRRNAANRLWAMMMGRGLVHPVDQDHSDNPPTHPQLLNLLSDALMAHGYDIKWFLRELALSETYQRSSVAADKLDAAAPDTDGFYTQAILKPLTPAQFASAIVEATGEAAVQRSALGNKLNEESLQKKLSGYEKRFVQLFGGRAGEVPEGFVTTADQVLFLSNDSMIHGLLRPKKGNLAHRLQAIAADDSKSIAEELFVSALNRMPSEQETDEVAAFLKDLSTEERPQAIQDLVWALVTSSEFRFNH